MLLSVVLTLGWSACRRPSTAIVIPISCRAVSDSGRAWRALHGNEIAYSFWDYQGGAWQRDLGLRIDHFLLSPQAADRLAACEIDRKQRGDCGDLPFLERVFHKLMLNFTWWVNRKDTEGRNVFQGGFLGLDNIGVFDRSSELPTGGHIDQSDGTSWMAMYSLNLMRIALELAQHNNVYEDIATKFFEHFLHIAEAMTKVGDSDMGLWDDTDKFYYDVLHLPDGERVPLKIRSMVGLIPLFAVAVMDHDRLKQLPEFAGRLSWFLDYRPDLARLVSRWQEPGAGERHLLSLLRGHRMKRVLSRMLDQTEFLSPHGIRSLSKVHAERPFVLDLGHGDPVGIKTPAHSAVPFAGRFHHNEFDVADEKLALEFADAVRVVGDAKGLAARPFTKEDPRTS